MGAQSYAGQLQSHLPVTRRWVASGQRRLICCALHIPERLCAGCETAPTHRAGAVTRTYYRVERRQGAGRCTEEPAWPRGRRVQHRSADRSGGRAYGLLARRGMRSSADGGRVSQGQSAPPVACQIDVRWRARRRRPGDSSTAGFGQPGPPGNEIGVAVRHNVSCSTSSSPSTGTLAGDSPSPQRIRQINGRNLQ